MYKVVGMRSYNNIKEEYMMITDKTKTRELVDLIKEKDIGRK